MSTRLAQLLPKSLTHHVRTGRDLMASRRRAPEEQCLSTGCESLDRLLQGGLRRGQMTELVSQGSSGRFSMVLSALAATTLSGDAAALIDLGDALSPASATAAGIQLERLLWVRPQHMKEALMAAEAVISCGMPLVVLDLGVPPIPGGRGVEAFWLRLTRSAQSRRSAVLVASPYRVTGTTAQMVVEAKDRHIVWCGQGLRPRLLDKLSNRLQLIRGPGWQRADVETVTWNMESVVAEAPPVGHASQSTGQSTGQLATPPPTDIRGTKPSKDPDADPLMSSTPRRRAIA